MTRTAQCRCGRLRAQCDSEPVRVSVCHCLECQRRTGSAFAAQARFVDDKVRISGASKQFVRIADSGAKVTYWFCPECGSTVAYVCASMPGLTAIPLGAFADPDFPAPEFSVYERSKRPWVDILGEGVEHTSA